MHCPLSIAGQAAKLDDVCPCTAVDDVVTAIASDDIVTVSTQQSIGAVAANQKVVAAATSFRASALKVPAINGNRVFITKESSQ